MQLMIQRGQRIIIIFPFFDLWAKFELNSEEDALISKYRVRKYILVEGKPLQRLRAAIFGIIIAGLFAAIIQHIIDIQQFSLAAWALGSYLLYHQFREEIRVSDILDGRHFICRSVVKLMLKEQEVAEMAHAFRHLLEAMKNWGGREIIELEPYKQPMLRLLEPPQVPSTGGEIRLGLPPDWIKSIGIITGLAGIGGFLYLGRPGGVTSNVAQEPAYTSSTLFTAKSNVPQKTPVIQQPDIWRENLQEADIMQVLSSAEDMFWQVKNRAAKSSSPKQGNRKIARAANDRGISYLQSGRIADAINAFQEAYRTNPADVEIVNNLGYAYLLNKDPNSAEQYILAALTMRWDRSAAWGNLGQVYAKKEQMADAVASFTNAYQFSRDLNQTNTYFKNRMEKENDANLKLALRQAVQIGEKWYMKK
jgi:tetratricopeptide (TPR) repeat protein